MKSFKMKLFYIMMITALLGCASSVPPSFDDLEKQSSTESLDLNIEENETLKKFFGSEEPKTS
jgi:hypothetical protein